MRLSPSSSETARGVMPFALRTSSSFATTSGSTWAQNPLEFQALPGHSRTSLLRPR